MKAIFNAFQAKLAAGVPAIKFSDFDLGQFDVAEPPVSFPAALLSFQGSSAEQVSGANDAETFIVEVAIGFRLRERTHSAAGSQYREQALEHLDTVQAVRLALTGMSGQEFTPLKYLGFVLERRSDLRVYRQRYETTEFAQPSPDVFVPWPGESGPDFCVHPDIDTGE